MSTKLTTLLLLLSVSLAIQAQQLGILRGTVMDESGALVPGAKVTVSNAAGPVKSVTAGDDGSYSIAGIPPGKYTVTATSQGLVQFQPASIDLSNGGNATLVLKLRVALEKQEVTVRERGTHGQHRSFAKRRRAGAARRRSGRAFGRPRRSAV